MIEAIRNIGEYSLEKEGKSINNPLEILLDDPESNHKNPTYKNIFSIVLQEINGEYIYKNIEHERYSKEKLKKYLYKQGNSRGIDITPTSRITRVKEDGAKKTTFELKILSWFKEYKKLGSNENINFLVKIGDCLRRNKNKIKKDLEIQYEGINKKEKCIITIKINDKYPGEYNIFRNILVNSASEKFYKKYGEVAKSENKLCSICKKKNGEVYGFVNTFNFYTVDKPGFVSGGFQQKDAWKNYPVCLNCALTLEEGKKYLEKNLNFNLLKPNYGVRYFLIPKFISGVDKETKNEIFEIMKQQKDPKFRKTEINRLTNAEEELLELMSKQKNYLNMNFMFYTVSNAEFKILLYVENILPSRLRELFDAKKDIDNVEIFKGCMVPVSESKKKTGERSLEFNFDVLQDFFYDFTNKRWISRKYFLDIVNKIFTGKPVDYDFLLDFIMQKIRDDFINGYPTKIDTLKAFMLLNYLNKLKILKYKKEEMTKMEKLILPNEIGGEIKTKIESFFDKFSDFFDSNIKKGIFLEGTLAQKLLNIQRLPEVSNAQAGKEPFRPRLKSLKLDEKQIRKLLPEMENKLEEYEKNYYRDLESIISYYFVSSGNNWNITNDEISFYFVLGMNLSDLFKKEKNNGGKENE
ncbi:MAG TPA: TIGR02556 family CRISPR-associated protein [Candidatus Atribacteria bacterium]|nr:TIGR02556 family CRISPR-associated protein [Candidatus Atribacteria bacterium]